jgi:aminoglycoside/choline kinase family phosphotransferase
MNVPGVNGIAKIQAEASVRHFYRVNVNGRNVVAMVYPEPNREEIERIVRLTDVYLEHGILVPEIERVVDDRILLLRDLGDVSLQKAFRKNDESWRREKLVEVCRILAALQEIPIANTTFLLGHERLKWEMDFFLEHYVGDFLGETVDVETMRSRLRWMVDRIESISIFAHRDFHSRNMQVCDDRIFLVDFQDSMKAAPYYDLVSFSFDAYLDLGAQREFLLREVENLGIGIDREQYYLTALQRNIKAMGTFGYQVAVNKRSAYKKYMPRTIRHIKANPLVAEILSPAMLDIFR